MQKEALCFPPVTFQKKRPDKPSLSSEEIKTIVTNASMDYLPKSFWGRLFFGWALRRLFLRMSPDITEKITQAQLEKAKEWAEWKSLDEETEEWLRMSEQSLLKFEKNTEEELLKEALEEEIQ